MAIDRVSIRTMVESDLDAADRVCRAAFDAFIGGENVFGDRDFVYSRWRASPDQALVATVDGDLLGSNFLARWGSVGVFGPLSVRPDSWDRGIAKELMVPTVRLFEQWGTTHQGLFTFPHSPKHVGLYQHFGFWPGHLTALLGKPAAPVATPPQAMLLSEADDQQGLVNECREVTDRICAGLDLISEIEAVSGLGLGETVAIEDGDGMGGFAVCHIGSDTEAGSDTLYVKFGAAAPGPGEAERFGTLLDACEAAASDSGCTTIEAGVNTARVDAYRILLERGFRPSMYGVAMQRGEASGYNRQDTYLIDDWR